MDTCEATNILISKIRTLDPENAYRIMGYILIQGLAERDLLSLALGPESVLQNVIIKAKIHLGLPANTLSTPTTPSSPSPPPNPFSRVANSNNTNNPFPLSSPRLTNNGSFADFPEIPSSPHPWPVPVLPNNSSGNSFSPKSSPFLSYDNIRAGSALAPPLPKNLGNVGGDCSSNGVDFLDETQLDDYLSFLDDTSSQKEHFMDPRVQLGGFSVNNGDTHLHRRRFSESDVSFGAEDGSFGMGYRPCLYFTRGFCKNGDNCKFVHGDFGGDNMVEVNGPSALVGSPREMDDLYLQQQEEVMRMKAAQQQQRLAYSKYMNFLLQQQNDPQRLGAAAIMGDEFHKFGRLRPERNGILAFSMAEKANSASRQIYLTFPADSSFKDEDVSNYFSTFGPVQDVRIPYQQKRMFGFVTFVLPETVKLILARGNPHFICDSRVLVKPYKEKGKIVNNRVQQLLEQGNFSPSSSPSGLDPRELYDLPLGARMLYNNTQEMMLIRKMEEQAEMQQAIELQGRRLINLQLPDLRGDYVHRHQRSMSLGAPMTLRTSAPVNQKIILSSDGKNQEVLEEIGDSFDSSTLSTVGAAEHLQHEVNTAGIWNNDTVNSGMENFNGCGGNVEHVLPDSLFASPVKPSGNQHPDCPSALSENKESTAFSATSSSDNNATMPSTSSSEGASH